MKNRNLLARLSKNAALLVEAFVDSEGRVSPRGHDINVLHWEKSNLADVVALSEIWDGEARLCLTLLFVIAKPTGDYEFVRSFYRKREAELLNFAAEMDHPPSHAELARAISAYYLGDTRLADDPTAHSPFKSPFTNLAWKHIDWTAPLKIQQGWIRAIARWHPMELIENLSKYPEPLAKMICDPLAQEIIEETEFADELIIAWTTRNLIPELAPLGRETSHTSKRCQAFFNVKFLSELRNNRHHEWVMKLAAMPEFSSSEHAVDLLLRHCPDSVLKTVEAGIGLQTPWDFTDAHARLVARGMQELAGDGASLLRRILVHNQFQYSWAKALLPLILKNPHHTHSDVIRKIFLDHATGLSGKKIPDFWAVIATYDQGLFLPEWQKFAEDKSKPLREVAAGWLLTHRAEDAKTKTEKLLTSDVTDDRLAGLSLISALIGDEEIARLKTLHATEPTKQVRVAVAAVLAKHGIAVAAEPEKEVEGIEDFTEFEKRLAAKPKAIKLPKAPWLSPGKLPQLFTKDGSPLSDLALTFLFQRQAREKGEVNEKVAPMLAHLHRSMNAPFAHAMLDQWFGSDMKATTRWALDVAGITGDDSIIKRLIEPIETWCLGNNGSRAEWAVHAIALLGSEKALGTLDSLIQRYRSRRKYVGAAASVAILRTAELMGISTDELAERIVPDFGFNADGEREFKSSNGSITAVLFHDFKIGWRDEATDQLVANPPSRLKSTDEEELKETRKFLKEAVTRQISRLQDGMITGRRWAVDVWVGRFAQHPLFSIFAMRLVWGVYNTDDRLLRTFRRYPNGLTADAAGGLEEFSEPGISIGIPHRIEVDDKIAKAWAAHLKRFKVKPLFKQLDRPIQSPEPEHANHKEVRVTLDVKSTAGSLRRELLGRGWSLASPSDGGRLAGMWRRFPGCEIEAYLPVCDLHAASSKDDEVSLEAAYFARGNPKKNNCYDFPAESCVLTFDQIPPIIFSEILSDLKSLLDKK